MMLLVGAHLLAEDISGARAIDAGGVFVSAVDLPADRSAAEPEIVRSVAAVRHELTRRETFIAFRYGARGSSESEVREKCAPHAARWRAVLEQWRGHVELTVKIAPPVRIDRPRIAEVSGGADYMKKLAAARNQPLEDEARQVTEAAFAAIASNARWLPRSDGGWEYAVLTPRESLERLAEISEQLRASLARPFLLSGPWPLEVFSSE